MVIGDKDQRKSKTSSRTFHQAARQPKLFHELLLNSFLLRKMDHTVQSTVESRMLAHVVLRKLKPSHY